MTDDIENALRTALKANAEEITADGLLQPRPRPARRSRVRTPAIVIACVLALGSAGAVVGRALTAGHSPEASATVGPAAPTTPRAPERTTTTESTPVRTAAYVGKRWRLTAVAHGGATRPVPASYDAEISFSTAGALGLSDTVNGMSGAYTSTPAGFTVGPGMASTLVGYAGIDETRNLVIAAIRAISRPIDSRNVAIPPEVRAVVAQHRLVLTVGGYTMTLVEAGAAGDAKPPFPGSR